MTKKELALPISALEGARLTMYGYTISCADGLNYDGSETSVYVYTTKKECQNSAYDHYVAAWENYRDAEDLDPSEEPKLKKTEFVQRFEDGGATIQLSDHHVNFEMKEIFVALDSNVFKNLTFPKKTPAETGVF